MDTALPLADGDGQATIPSSEMLVCEGPSDCGDGPAR
jgi:hypothetical protein